MKEITGGVAYKVRNNIIKDEAGKLLKNGNDVKERRYQYSKKLYNQNVLFDDSVLDEPSQKAEEEPGILESEVRAAIQKLKSRKTPGLDRIDGDLK